MNPNRGNSHITALIVTLATCWGTYAVAEDLSVTVTGENGAPLAYAVAYVRSPELASAAADGSRPPATIDQRDQQFLPHSKAIQRRTEVTFPNSDNVRHHVYSFSEPKRFELPLYGDETPSPIAFDTAGAVALGCNIHDHMLGYLFIVDTPVFGSADSSGHIRLEDVPVDDDDAELRIWHPGLGQDSNGEPVQWTAGDDVQVTLPVVDEPPAEPEGLGGRRRNLDDRFGTD